MIDVDIREMIRGRSVYEESKTLCWTCSKACGNGCSWSRDGTPVQGWDAKPTTIMSYGTQSYAVRACPEYVKENRVKKARAFNDDACQNLIEKAIELARQDYIKTKSMDVRNEVVCFLADWLEEYEGPLKKLHADRNQYWGNKLLEKINKQIKAQPLLLYAGSTATEGT